MLLRSTSIVVLGLGLAGVGMSSAGCSTGTTPVCDDAGSCLISDDDAGTAPDTGSTEDADDGR